ncbi:hypothetical protein ABH920_007286 [Catenulispora sp. EB89]|uniref:hypothetical protein n=1 Tax=Catenulispora sp. EB89 TaxID=3156257 RepID=UPI003519861D
MKAVVIKEFADHDPYDIVLDVIGGKHRDGLEAPLNHAELVFKRLPVSSTTLLRLRLAGASEN